MKKQIRILMIFLFLLCVVLIPKKVFATETTQKLYQDITINIDGSITVKEAALLDGDYNGRKRNIDFSNYSAAKFTGIYSNFSGNTDIYNGTAITNIKIYDISQSNFNAISDIAKKEKEYKKVDSAKSGKYGVYTLSSNCRGADFKVFCPSSKEKIFCMEYTIENVVVVHNDVAELYWNVMGEGYQENIADFQVLIHLPGEDSDARIWTHGPLTGTNAIINKKTLSFKDSNVPAYTAETIRIMFDKALVPNDTKTSEVNGRENILKYEAGQADEANAERERTKAELINKANDMVIKLEEKKYMFYYNYAIEYVNDLDNSCEEKAGLLARIEDTKDEVNKEWKKDIEYQINNISNYKLSRYQLKRLKEDIEAGFDEEAKNQYNTIYNQLEMQIEKREAQVRKTYSIIVITIYALIGILAIIKFFKQQAEKNTFSGKYYRDFPSEDNPYVIEYLIKGKITNLSISATILSLVYKKVIKIEETPDRKDTILEETNSNIALTDAEAAVMYMLFSLAGNDKHTCRLSDLKEYGRTEYKAKRLTQSIDKFKKTAKKEAGYKGYFNLNNKSKILLIVTNWTLYCISLCMAFGVFYNFANFEAVCKYLLTITILSSVYSIIFANDYNRTKIGKEEYSKWLAHKRFLQDFSKFNEKDLPEIALWDRYLVTATILGCADKVQKKMNMVINNYDSTDINYTNLLLASSLNNNFIKDIDKIVNSSISTASATIAVASSSSSSGGGYGGGSSFGGGGGGRRRRWRSFLVLIKRE